MLSRLLRTDKDGGRGEGDQQAVILTFVVLGALHYQEGQAFVLFQPSQFG